MSVCFFNGNYEQKYRCEYVVKSDTVEVEVEYDIGQEMENIGGMRFWSSDKPIDDRDILIIDSDGAKYILIKMAYFIGSTSRLGSVDAINISKFKSRYYFKSMYSDNLKALLPMPKVKKIRIYSKTVIEYIGHPSVLKTDSEEEYVITMKRGDHPDTLSIGTNNIKSICIADEWRCNSDFYSMSIEFGGYIGLELMKRTNYTEIYDYIYEIMIYMQLYYPGRFKIDRLKVEIDNKIYEFGIPIQEINYSDARVRPSVQEGLLDFLKRCYDKIPYRKSKDNIRNIKYVIMNTSRNIEDNFLTFYRFIECNYKRNNIANFMTECIKNHYPDNISDDQKELKALEIISLRNHYVHSGYYIKNSNLRVSLGKDNHKTKKHHVTADFNWIYEQTKILYLMVIDIIFKDMLGFENYKYRNIF